MKTNNSTQLVPTTWKHFLLIVALLLCAASISSAIGAYQPDLFFALGGQPPRVGLGIYNLTGDNQFFSCPVRAEEYDNNDIYCSNAGTTSTAYTLKASGSYVGYTIVFTDPNNNDITSQMFGSGWTTPSLGAGTSTWIHVYVTWDNTSTIVDPEFLKVLVTARANAATSQLDALRIEVTADNYSNWTGESWLGEDIGTVGIAGSSSYDSGTGVYTVRGSGGDIWNSADNFHFVYKTMTGDGTIIAKITAIGNTNNDAKAGVMMRNTLTCVRQLRSEKNSADFFLARVGRVCPGG